MKIIFRYLARFSDTFRGYRQKQPPRCVLRKKCSDNMQQIYRRTPMLCNFIEITLWHGCSPVNLLHIFRTPFPKNTSGWLLLYRDERLVWNGLLWIFRSWKCNHKVILDWRLSGVFIVNFEVNVGWEIKYTRVYNDHTLTMNSNLRTVQAYFWANMAKNYWNVFCNLHLILVHRKLLSD